MEHFSNDHKDGSNQHENNHKLCNEKGHPLLGLKEKMKTETTVWSEFPKGRKSTAYLPTITHRAGRVQRLVNVPRYARIEEITCIFKNPLKFSRIVPYFQFLNDFISRVFIDIVFFLDITLQMKCLIYARCMGIVSHKFASNSFFILQDGRQQETKTLNSIWLIVGKRISNRTCFTKQTCLLLSHMSKSYFLQPHG